MRVLLADDDRIQVQMVSSRLKAKGVDVVVAFDAMEAWMIAMKTPPDAIVLDINMPGGSGLDVLKKLKTSSKTNQIPVIVASGSIGVQDEQKVRDLGADEFLRKPLDLDHLNRSLSRLLGKPLGPAPEAA